MTFLESKLSFRVAFGTSLVSALVFFSSPLQAQEIDDQVARMMSEGWRAQTSHVIIRAPSGSVRRLSGPEQGVAAGDARLEKLRALVDLRFQQPGTRAVLISQSGVLQVERYLSGAVSASSTPIGNSMSKSLVSLAVGKALCQGKIASLDLKAEQFVESLAGTSWGRS